MAAAVLESQARQEWRKEEEKGEINNTGSDIVTMHRSSYTGSADRPAGPSQILRIKSPTCKNMEIARQNAVRSAGTGWPSHRFAFAATFKLLKGDTIERLISLSVSAIL